LLDRMLKKSALKTARCSSRRFTTQCVLKDIDFIHSDSPEIIAQAFNEFGACIVRGLNRKYVNQIREDVMAMRAQTLKLFEMAKNIPEGQVTPDGSLLIPKGDGSQQIMVLGLDYFSSAALFQVSVDEGVLNIVESILGDGNIELFGKGQVLLKEKDGGHAKNAHQDAAYFEFKNYGPVGTLNYCVDTNRELNNGPLYVWPGTHKSGYLEHVDTESHLALPLEDWPLESGICLDGDAGDCILFHQYMVHGSGKNYSAVPRPTFINRYIQCEDQPIMPLATGVKMRAEALEKAKTIQPTRDMGYMVRGNRIYNADVQMNTKVRDKQFH